MNKIITKILLSIILCSILVAVSIGFLSIFHASKNLRQESFDKLQYASTSYANEFSAKLKNVEGVVDAFESVVATSFDLNQFQFNLRYRYEYIKNTNDMLKTVAGKISGIQGIYFTVNPKLTGRVFQSWYISDGKGSFVYQEPEDISEFYPSNKDMEWYYKPINKKEGVWLPPYVDATIKVKMISYTKAVFSDGQFIGVIGIDIAFKDIEKTIEEMKLFESGYSFLLDRDYKILLHPEIEANTSMKTLKDEGLDGAVESMNKKTSGAVEYYYKNKKKVMGFSRLSNGWILGVSTVASDIFIPVDRLKNSIIVSVLILLIVTAIIGLFISKSITEPINNLKDKAALISKGEHDVELDLNSNNEIGELSKSIHIMTRELITSHEELKMSEEKFRALADTSPLAVYMSEGIEQRAVYINPTFVDLFGYTMEEVPTADHWFPLAYPDPLYRKQITEMWQKIVKHAIESKSDTETVESVVRCKDGSDKHISWGFINIGKQNWAFGLNLTERKLAEKDREETIEKLKKSLEEIKSLRGILPICAKCKNIRNDEGYYEQIESYIQKHSEAVFSHGLCPDCSDELYGNKEWYKKKKEDPDLS